MKVGARFSLNAVSPSLASRERNSSSTSDPSSASPSSSGSCEPSCTHRLIAAIARRGPALDLLLTGRQVDPAEAQRLGIVNGLFASEDELRAHVERLAAGPPLAIANIKRAAYRGSELTLDDGLRLERDLIEELFRSDDAREGLTAFTEKRAAAFTGA